MKPLSAALGAYERVEAALLWVSYAAVFALMSLTTVDAFSRYLFSAPLEGMQEAADEFLMPALVYFSMAYLYHRGGQVRVTSVSDRLPPGLQRALRRIFDAMTAGLFALVTWALAARTLDAWETREYSTSPLNYVIAPSYAIVAIGAAMMVVRAVQAAVTGSQPQTLHADIAE